MKYTISCTEKQLQIIGAALEDYLRTRMGQFNDLADDLAFTPVFGNVLKPSFDAQIANRNAALPMFQLALNAAQPYRRAGMSYEKTDNQALAEDMWQIIRHQVWKDTGGPTRSPNSVDSYPPLILTTLSEGFEISSSGKPESKKLQDHGKYIHHWKSGKQLQTE